jgi:adenylate cyclase
MSRDHLRRDPGFQDYHKFVQLVSEFFGSMSAQRQYQSRFEKLRQFLSPRIVAMLALGGQQSLDEKLKPRIAEVTALFCDLRGFSRHVENAGELLPSWQQISAALDLMTSAINDNEGVIGGLQGDAAVGFWGWPESKPDQIDLALRTALRIRRDFARQLQSHTAFQFRYGIGIAHGPAVVGRLGVFDHLKLDAYGPVMNLASRLESMTKQFGVPIIVDAAVAQYVRAKDPYNARARVRRLAKVRPAGMSAAVEISELLPPITEADVRNEGNIPRWELAARLFSDGKWREARQKLQSFLGTLPKERAVEDKASQLLSQFMQRTNDACPEGWDGVLPMETK